VRRFVIAAPLLFALAATAPCWAATTPASTQGTAATTQGPAQLPGVVDPKQWTDIQSQLARASAVVGRFKSDPKMIALMRQARGVFIVPAFGHGTSPSAGAWGSGVLMANNKGQWSDAVFFTLGGGSLGPHVIANGGSLILFVMNDRAMGKFESGTNWSLSSAPGTNIVNYSTATPQDLSGQGADIVAWSASGGPNSDTEVSVNDISVNTALNSTVYGTPDLRNILASRAPYINQDVINLRSEMSSTASAATSSPESRPSRHA
jgi:SH3 domain-containing YSC84-like protein 1